ncbi:hypothetical protein M9C82_01145 [SAR86 cluster bacterium]|nr:hypothetical protein M9C82_01145 [SAR86 cluster bacterium]
MKITKNILLLPKNKIDIYEELHNAGKDKLEVKKTIRNTGIKSVHKVDSQTLSDFVFEGLSNIKKDYHDFFENVDSVIVVSQSFDHRIPSLSTRIQDKFNIPEKAFCIDIMDGCSGYIKSLGLTRMLHQIGCKKFLVISGDLNSKMTTNSEIGTKILFGDGISVSIIEPDETESEIRLFNRGDNENIINCSMDSNKMNMNGFEVFRFTKNEIPRLINNYLSESGKSINDFDLLALHQASKLVVSTICNSVGFKNNLCQDFSCDEIGNLGAGSIGAWISQINDLTKMDSLKMLAVGFGSGLSWGLISISLDVCVNEVIYV